MHTKKNPVDSASPRYETFKFSSWNKEVNQQSISTKFANKTLKELHELVRQLPNKCSRLPLSETI